MSLMKEIEDLVRKVVAERLDERLGKKTDVPAEKVAQSKITLASQNGAFGEVEIIDSSDTFETAVLWATIERDAIELNKMYSWEIAIDDYRIVLRPTHCDGTTGNVVVHHGILSVSS